MKKQEHRTEFIQMRAEGKSLRAIAAELGVSKSTLSEWDRELASEIAKLRSDALEELYSEYGMAKEARIRLGCLKPSFSWMSAATAGVAVAVSAITGTSRPIRSRNSMIFR